MMDNIEVEVRSFVSKNKYQDYKKNWQTLVRD